MEEENDEYLQACANNYLVEIADALGDQMYILCGTILKHGMQHIIQEVFDEIHASNMSKLDPDGKPILREDGKILKGPGYFKPEINKFIENKEGEQ
jgi:predicted HAD superfamily Cof-like phosphohydrolase